MMVSRLLVGVILGLATAWSTPAAAQAILTFADQPSLGAIPDSPSGICQTPGPPRDVTFNFTGVPGVVHGVEIGAQLTHAWVGDVLAQLIAPNGTSHDIFGYTGAAAAASSGDGSDLLGTYVFSDSAPLQWWGTAASFDNVTALPSGTYRTSFRGGAGGTGAASQLSAAFDGLPAAGIWKLRLTDGCHNDAGAVGIGTYLQLDTTEPIVDPLPPFGLAVASIVGNLVTLSWDYNIVDGPQPTGFILEGGMAPGQVLASIPTGDTNIFFTFVAPTGAFYVRVRSRSGDQVTAPSNEIRLFVGVPVPPSAPRNLLGLVNGTSVGLAWRNTYDLGPSQSTILEVSGSQSGSIRLPPTDMFAFAGVPGGTYTFAVRSANQAGTSGASNPVTLTFPGACSGAPDAPSQAWAYNVGRMLFLVWTPAAIGPAPSGFVLNVTGGLAATLPLTRRSISGTVPPGTYTFTIVATNACGTSATRFVRTLTIP